MIRIKAVYLFAGLSVLLSFLVMALYIRLRSSLDERKRRLAVYDEAVKEKDQAVRALKDRQFALLDQMPVGVIIVDKSGKVNEANAAAERMLATKKEHLRNIPLARFAIDFELSKQLGEALAGKKTGKEIRITRPENRILQARVSPMNKDDTSGGAVVVLEDITKIRQLEQARQELVSSFSHELRTPIASCQTTLEALIDWRGDRDTEVRGKFLDNLANQVEHLSSLVDKLLQLTRLESDESILDLKKSSSKHLAEKAFSTMVVLAQAKNIEFTCDADEDAFVYVDEELFLQALINLVDNAIKYTQPGGKVSLRTEVDEDQVLFSVSDNGPGISKNDIGRIFERFYRIDKHRSREKGGHGLGLALVKHIVNAHKGTIEVDSSPLEGSTFTIAIKKAS